MNKQLNCNDCSSLFVTHDQKEDGGVIILALSQNLFHLLR